MEIAQFGYSGVLMPFKNKKKWILIHNLNIIYPPSIVFACIDINTGNPIFMEYSYKASHNKVKIKFNKKQTGDLVITSNGMCVIKLKL